MKKYAPLFIFLFGLIILNRLPEVAFGCFIVGIVIIIERIWPEKWDVDEKIES